MRAARPSFAALVGLVTVMALIGTPMAQASPGKASVGPTVRLGAGTTNCPPVTAPDGDGVLAVAVDAGSKEATIRVRRWSPTGGWGPSRALSGGLQMPLSCRLSAASDGRVAVVSWTGYQSDGQLVLQSAVRPSARAAWQRAATLMPSALDTAPGVPAAEPAYPRAVVSNGRAVVVWNTWVGSDPDLGGIEAAAWQAGSWQPTATVVPGGTFVYVVDVLPTTAGVVALASRQGADTRELVSRSWTWSGGWAPEQVVSTSAVNQCWTDAAHGGTRTVLLEMCKSGDAGRLWIREWLGRRWSARVAISPTMAGFDAYSFREIRATSRAVAVAYQVPGKDPAWSVSVVRSTARGRWPKPVRMVSSDIEYARPSMFALGGGDATLVWVRPNADAKPGEVQQPVLATTLLADGQLLPDVEVGYSVMVTCHSATSGEIAVVFVWSSFCQEPFRVASWSGKGAWTLVDIKPPASDSNASDYTWGATPTATADVIAWQTEGGVLGASVTR